jgi:endonuclease-3
MNKAIRREIFSRLRAANPQPTTELEYRSPFELLIAVILSAQATDVSVNKATRGLFRAARTPSAMLALGEAGVREHIKTIGLFNAKARNGPSASNWAWAVSNLARSKSALTIAP